MELLTYTVEQAAELLNVGRSSLYVAIRKGEVPSVRICGRRLIPRAALENLLKTSVEQVAIAGGEK